MVPAKRTRDSVYYLKYHFVWISKYRKWVFKDEVGHTLENILKGIADPDDIEIDTLEIMPVKSIYLPLPHQSVAQHGSADNEKHLR